MSDCHKKISSSTESGSSCGTYLEKKASEQIEDARYEYVVDELDDDGLIPELDNMDECDLEFLDSLNNIILEEASNIKIRDPMKDVTQEHNINEQK